MSLMTLEQGTLRVMRATLVGRINDSGHEHDQSDQLRAIDAELQRRDNPETCTDCSDTGIREHNSQRVICWCEAGDSSVRS